MSAQKTPQLKALLKKANAPLKFYVAALESENLKLQKQIAKLQANQVTLESRVKAVEQEAKKGKPPQINITVAGSKPEPKPS
jgi:uncharacterized protein YlxW (UPF0749 family)